MRYIHVPWQKGGSHSRVDSQEKKGISFYPAGRAGRGRSCREERRGFLSAFLGKQLWHGPTCILLRTTCNNPHQNLNRKKTSTKRCTLIYRGSHRKAVVGTAPVTAIATFHRLMGYGAVQTSGRGGKNMCRLLLLRISQRRRHQRRRRRTLAAFALPLLLLLLSLRGVCAVLASWAVGGLLFCLRSKGRVVRRFAKATVLFCVVGKRKNTQLQFRAERTGARQHEAYIHAVGLTNPTATPPSPC